VHAFSDRDIAREATVFRHKAFGRRRMNRDIVETARTYRPHMVMFGHADMTGADTFAAVRAAVPGVRLAQYNLDPTFRSTTMARFRERSADMDMSFITTGARDRLANLRVVPGTAAYIPNPVDAALSVADVSLLDRLQLRFDGIFLGSSEKRRDQQVRQLVQQLPRRFRFQGAGGLFGTPRLSGPGFLETLASAAMSPSLPLDDTVAVEYLYASDRLAQVLGNGLVSFSPESAQLDVIYDDGIVNYTTIEDLAEKMFGLAQDDARRRQIGATGRRIALERTSAERVARYMLDLTFEDAPAQDYGWPSEPV